ncbi:Pls/PosA family non-ribosomal peptide synthetase [Agreia sp. COWG]|uniref:Pls/PosA family non-ribosomal peptide synthetase n=1 Tax=Agreia sp. COWG TaxID=2773266 RepID=UPI001AF8C29E|nr:Pls/PosA family non-ribosomal peptide synthetase [Agreia sp. COWG]CAD6000257.1 Amino acid adenylation protein [Agreia sp. COWG]
MTDSPALRGLLLGGARTPPPRTLVDILRETAAEHPAAAALADADGTVSYRELLRLVGAAAVSLSVAGVRRGDRVGIRIPSGGRTLYVSILAVLFLGAAYVPVDADDPEERAELVFGEADVVGWVGADGTLVPRASKDGSIRVHSREPVSTEPLRAGTGTIPTLGSPELDDDAWIIFTSGSTGVPKGVAVTHRSAAAFVDAEARMFLQQEPLEPGDRVLAGLSVAFDASCEEMWLAWRHGACLVPAPRSLVKSGADLGPWLIAHGITVVSTVPTLAGLWPAESLENVRLLIFGGEACPPELAQRLATDGRELWNTYGPTEATVVACGALLDGSAPVRIGLPLDGWDLAVVDAAGDPVADGEVGELIIGGVGLARYLDASKDAEKYAAMPSLGWPRAYRSGDLVRFDREGLVFQGRADDQVKLGGRRIELGEIEAALQALPGVHGAAAVVQTSGAGNQVLVGYLALDPGVDESDFDLRTAADHLRQELPAALVPALAVVESIPTRISGKVDRAALPWPLPGSASSGGATLEGTTGWLASLWTDVLGATVGSATDDFFALGGGSLAAAQLTSIIRARFPEARVSDIYDHPRIGALADELDSRVPAVVAEPRLVKPTPLSTRWAQTLLGIPLHVIVGARWSVYLLAANAVLIAFAGLDWLPAVSWWWLIVGFMILVTPLGRMAVSVVAARLLLRGVTPGSYPRGGQVHLRLWLAEQVASLVGAASLAGAPWIAYYARALGATVGEGVDLHSLPPVTGMLKLGARVAIEPEVDLSGWWIDGDLLRIGAISIGADATIGSRSTMLPGARVGRGAEVAPGSSVSGRVPGGERWSGSPAQRLGKARPGWPAERPPRASGWVAAYGAGSVLLSLLPLASLAVGALITGLLVRGSTSLGELALRAFASVPLATLGAGIVFAALVVVSVRLLGLGLAPGYYPVRSRVGWQVWATERLLDLSRTMLFPLYASLFTPVWLRLLGAKVGVNVEASTVLLLPAMTTIGDHAFLADDTMVASYELGGGWLRIDEAKIGRRAFLGNSGMTGPGRTVPKNGLVAVLSATPKKAKSGSSWLGNPPVRLRRAVAEFDEGRTYKPKRRLRVARALWETGRVVPVMVSTAIGLGVLLALEVILETLGLVAAIALSGVVMLAAGAVAAGITTIAKWTIVGRITAREHPLWSSFIWRNEVADTFVEMVAAPWFARAATGTPALAWWLSSLGARIGEGAWIESYWLPEADLVSLGAGSTVNRGCVVQTHLFHDRVMSLDAVELAPGATLGPHSVILPAARIDSGATVGPASLVMRGEVVPPGSRWTGNPIGPWNT